MTETLESHLAWILERIGRTETSRLPLRAALGLALAEDASALHELPPWHSSAMDGYALRAAEVAGASAQHPVELRIVGEVAAGSGDDPELPPGCAVRIMTGAPLPTQADTVVPVELTLSDRPDDPWSEAVTRVCATIAAGANVRRRGEDVRAGELVAPAGSRLDAARASALAAVGLTEAAVHLPPRIAVVTTGSELRPAGTELDRGQIPESNSLLLLGLLAEAGFEVAVVEHRADDASALAQRIAQLAAEHEVIITSGGVGPGRHDVVRIALEDEPDIRSVRVAVRPGQPQCAGRHRGGAFLFGLPGNPVSAAVSMELFVLPALRALAGRTRIHRPRLIATATEGWRAAPGRVLVLPVRLEANAQGLSCSPALPIGRISHSVAGHAARDGYALIGPERGDVAAGEEVQVIATGLR